MTAPMTPEVEGKVREALIACFSLMPNNACRDISCGCLSSKITAALSALDTPQQAGTPTPRSEGLLPCAFCGKPAATQLNEDDSGMGYPLPGPAFFVSCPDDECPGGQNESTPEVWNRRALPVKAGEGNLPELPKGCPEVAVFSVNGRGTKSIWEGLIPKRKNGWVHTPIEIHPVGTRARLSAHQGESNKENRNEA